jgi:hypothetical protein
VEAALRNDISSASNIFVESKDYVSNLRIIASLVGVQIKSLYLVTTTVFGTIRWVTQLI